MIDRQKLRERLEKAYQTLLAHGKIHSQSELARAIDVKPSYMSDAFNLTGRAMTKNLLLRIADAFPDVVSRKYMETGEGSVELPGVEMRPHVEANAAAGFMIGLSSPDDGHDRRSLISFVPPYDFTISVKGDSMEPLILDGDLLACRFADDRYNVPFGKICVIDAKDGAVVKILLQGDDCALLRSINPKYKDYTVPYDDIQRIALVVASVHNFTSRSVN